MGKEAASNEFALSYETQYETIENLRTGIEQVRDWIEKNKNRLELHVSREGRSWYLIDPEEFRKDACAGLDCLRIAEQLKAGKSHVPQGRRTRYTH